MHYKVWERDTQKWTEHWINGIIWLTKLNLKKVLGVESAVEVFLYALILRTSKKRDAGVSPEAFYIF